MTDHKDHADVMAQLLAAGIGVMPTDASPIATGMYCAVCQRDKTMENYPCRQLPICGNCLASLRRLVSREIFENTK